MSIAITHVSRYNEHTMPELPEVETVRAGLQQFLVGQKILSVTTDWPKSFPNDPKLVRDKVVEATVLSVDRRGKALIIPLTSAYSLLIHLKMTGQLVYRPKKGKGFGGGHPNESLIGSLPDSSTHVIIELTSGTLFFNDQRKFGWVRLEKSAGLYESDAFLQKLGPEPLSESYTFEQFKKAVNKRKNTSIKAAILDQTVVAGVGNIYADESLFAAGIHPATKAGEVSSIKLKKLFTALREIMQLSIKLGGSSDRNYVDAEGKKGSYLKFAKVFRREGKACPECGSTITKIRVAGRGTHVCPKCQPIVGE